MKGGGPGTNKKFVEILENAYFILTNILEVIDTSGIVKLLQTMLNSHLANLKKLQPLSDRFELLKNILTTINEYRFLKSKDEFIDFLQDKNPVIDIRSIEFNSVESKLEPYVIMLDHINYIYNNFRNSNQDKYKELIAEIKNLTDLIRNRNPRSKLMHQLVNITSYFHHDSIEKKINYLIRYIIPLAGGKKKRSIKKRLKKKRSKKKRH